MLRALASTRLSRPTSVIVIVVSLTLSVVVTVHALRPSAAYRRALAELRHEPIAVRTASSVGGH